jgi:hypothetical protein
MVDNHISEIVPDEYKSRARVLARDHVDWLFFIMRDLLETEFCHGYRHGWEDGKNEKSGNSNCSTSL